MTALALNATTVRTAASTLPSVTSQVMEVTNLDVTPEETAAGRAVNGVIGAVVGALVANIAVAAIAHRAGVPVGFSPLQPAAFAPMTFAGVALGAVGWGAIRGLTRSPARVLRWLVPLVLILSWIPDVILFSGAGVAAVGTLMLMQLSTALVAVPMLAWSLPVGDCEHSAAELR